MILVKLLGFAMLIGAVMGSVLGLQIVIDRLVAGNGSNLMGGYKSNLLGGNWSNL